MVREARSAGLGARNAAGPREYSRKNPSKCAVRLLFCQPTFTYQPIFVTPRLREGVTWSEFCDRPLPAPHSLSILKNYCQISPMNRILILPALFAALLIVNIAYPGAEQTAAKFYYIDEIDALTVESLTPRAEQGDAEAQYELAKIYAKRHGEEDYKAALKWYTLLQNRDIRPRRPNRYMAL